MNDNELLDQITKDAEATTEALQGIMKKVLPPDIDTTAVLERAMMIGVGVGSRSRTTAFGAVMLAASYAPVVGITKDQLHTMIDDVVDLIASMPSTAEAAKNYAENNAAQKAAKLSGGGVVLPGSNIVH